MAEVLKEFDWEAATEPANIPKPVYHWDDWFNGDIWLLEQGKDFYIHPLMMERITRTRAAAPSRHAKIQLRHIGLNGDRYGKLILQRTDIIGPTAAKRAERRAKTAATRAAKTNGATAKTTVKSKRPTKKLAAAK